ncbi:hypothetical protein [Microbacterium immunditiarum]|uniref:Uncharacterized protein n=1 Tax=Microbacterium immunditiarum TaxID=337480 RepID=A0A7Y9KHU3_9MICO|nr:hypothetical protein [Microbacterium immunditiarum]NYE18055.1 hypothetical protein [Microbacterium immunditiarum]
MTDHTTPAKQDDPIADMRVRLGLVALSYFPEIHAVEPDYRLTDDVAWVLEPIAEFIAEEGSTLAELVARTVIDPTAYREELMDALNGLPIPRDGEPGDGAGAVG